MISTNWIYGNALKITVDGTNGNDTTDCFNSTKPCKTLDYALRYIYMCNWNKTIVISIENGTYNYSLDATNSTHQFWNYSSISIIGKGWNNSRINCNKTDAGFAFFRSPEILIQDISIMYCGSHQNGTSYNLTVNAASMVSAALYFAFCQNVSIVGSVIEDSNNTGVVMYNTDNTLNVTNSKFSNNRNKQIDTSGGGGFYAEFTFCDPGFTENCVQHSYSNATYVFESSVFSNNSASDRSEQSDTFIRASGKYNIAFGRGGGLSLLFKGNVKNSTVTINNCNISSNTATWGAGLFIEFQDNSNHNTVSISDTKIDGNSCELNVNQSFGTGGGGARVGFISFTQNSVQHNTIAFEHCHFNNNIAYWGGGLSYYTFRERNTINATNILSFTSCSWNNNIAILGSAIDLSVWHPIKSGVLSSVLFYNCTFTGNTNEPQNTPYYVESSLGTGAFYSDSIPVAFQYSLLFRNNKGSAMALSATSATFMKGCESQFLQNTGWTGGAIALLGNAWLKIYDLTNFTFSNNSATLNGGAISVLISSRHDLPSSRNCFLQYFDQFAGPQNWSTSFHFTSNSAPGGHGLSIFATSLLSCVWGNSTGSVINGTSAIPFHNWTIFNFSKSNASHEISTEIADIVNVGTDLKISPGQPSKLPFNFMNDFKQTVNDSIYLLPDHTQHHTQQFSVVNNLTAESNVILLGPKDSTSTFSLQVVTDGPRIVSENIRVKFSSCPPGYFWVPSSNSSAYGKCICAYRRNESWNGLLYCDDDKFQAYIKNDYWAGYKNDKDSIPILYTGKCPKGYCGTPDNTLLPSSAESLNRVICGDQNRNNTLCGECQDGYCVAINSRSYKCTNNVDKHSWIILLATEYLPSTVLLVFLLFYDINLHSKSLGSVVMYFQVYSALNIYSDGEIDLPNHSFYINKAINFLYNIWNLEYIGLWLKPYCLAKNLNTLQVLMISYISGFYPFLLIFIYIALGSFKRFSFCNPCVNFCIRLKWKASLKASIINGLSTFWTLAYTKLALVSCLILTVGYLEPQNGLSLSKEYVVLLQGNYEYFHKDHLPYAITALVILIFFVILPSFALLCYPLTTRIMAKIKKYVDLDNNRFYVYISDKMERPFIRLKPLLDSFQGPYKQGCEFFAGLMYWYRLGIFFTYSLASGSKAFYINSVISIIFVTLISFFQPFKKAKNNNVMLLITVNITVINLISLYNYYEVISEFMAWLQLLLIIFPLVYFAGCTAYGIKKKIQGYIKCAPPAGLYTYTSSLNNQEFDNSLLQNMAEEL